MLVRPWSLLVCSLPAIDKSRNPSPPVFFATLLMPAPKKMSSMSEFESEVSEISPNFTRAVLWCAVALCDQMLALPMFFFCSYTRDGHKGWAEMKEERGIKKRVKLNVEDTKTPKGGGREQNVKGIIGGGIIEKLLETFLA